MTQTPPTLSEVITAYQQRGHGLWTGEPLNPAGIEMLIRLKASEEAAQAFDKMMKSAAEKAAQTLAKDKAEAPRAAAIAVKALTKRKEETPQAFAKRKEEAAQAHAKRLVKEAEQAFARIAPPEMKALFLVDDCMEAREIDAGKHQAQVERLRTTPSDEEMWTKLAELAIHIGASDEHDIEAIRMMGVALGYRRRRHEYERLSTSRRGDKAAARSEAIAWIKSSVLRLSGKSPLDPRIAKSDIDHVIALCDVVLDTSETIGERSVRRAVTKEGWLNTRFPEKKRRRLKKVLSPKKLG